jgi:hypothetical protein
MEHMRKREYLRSVIVLGLMFGQPVLWFLVWRELPLTTAGAFSICIGLGIFLTACRIWWLTHRPADAAAE